jgi:ADP-ribosylglycohydrolase
MTSQEILQDKFRGAILGCFLGDAFGSGFEGMNPNQAMFHMDALSKRFPRSYTDDTDMTLALGESIIQSGEIDPEEIAKQFSLTCDLTRGYAIGTIKAIIALRAGLPWHQVGRIVFEKGSFGNGAAMRVSPVGLFYHHDLDGLQEAAMKQAAVTHVHPLGQWGAVMHAATIGWAVNQDPKGPFKKEEAIGHLREVLWRGPIEYMRALNKIEEMVAQGNRFEAKEVVRSLGNGWKLTDLSQVPPISQLLTAQIFAMPFGQPSPSEGIPIPLQGWLGQSLALMWEKEDFQSNG